jgi:hypothetical protein
MSAIESKEQLIKMTVLLPRDTIEKLDIMAAKALMGSRGRVIQSIVDSLWDSQSEIQTILNNINTAQKPPPANPLEAQTRLMMILFPMANVLNRVNKYLGVSVPASQPTQPTVKQ